MFCTIYSTPASYLYMYVHVHLSSPSPRLPSSFTLPSHSFPQPLHFYSLSLYSFLPPSHPPSLLPSLLTSTSHMALELVASVFLDRPDVLRNTFRPTPCLSHVRNFSCSAWNSRTTSPCVSRGTADHVNIHFRGKEGNETESEPECMW